MTGGKRGYIRPDGSTAIEPQFNKAESFLLGMAVVYKSNGSGIGTILACVNGKSGFVDTGGNFVIPPEYDDASGFDGFGLVQVRK